MVDVILRKAPQWLKPRGYVMVVGVVMSVSTGCTSNPHRSGRVFACAYTGPRSLLWMEVGPGHPRLIEEYVPITPQHPPVGEHELQIYSHLSAMPIATPVSAAHVARPVSEPMLMILHVCLTTMRRRRNDHAHPGGGLTFVHQLTDLSGR